MGDHLRAAVPLRNTVTLVPRVTQNDMPLSAAVMVSLLGCAAGAALAHATTG